MSASSNERVSHDDDPPSDPRAPETRPEPHGLAPCEPEAGRLLIGWREWVALPSFGVHAIKAKVDTGARTSAVHAEGIERHTVAGTPMLSFRIHPFRGDRVTVVAIEAPLVDERLVRSSDGDAQLRPIVRTTLVLADTEREIEISLACRDLMGFRMLLGRVALAGMLVDPTQSYVWGAYEPPVPFRPSNLPPPLREEGRPPVSTSPGGWRGR